MDTIRPNEFDMGPLPEDAHARLIHLSNVFGRVLFDSVRNPAMDRARAMPERLHGKPRHWWTMSCTPSSNLDGVARPNWERPAGHAARAIRPSPRQGEPRRYGAD